MTQSFQRNTDAGGESFFLFFGRVRIRIVKILHPSYLLRRERGVDPDAELGQNLFGGHLAKNEDKNDSQREMRKMVQK